MMGTVSLFAGDNARNQLKDSHLLTYKYNIKDFFKF